MIPRPPQPDAPLFSVSAKPLKNRLGLPATKFLALRGKLDAPPFAPVDPNVASVDAPRLSGQNLRVLERLQRGPLTCTEAIQDMNIRRLAARIFDLRKHGYSIQSTALAGGDQLYSLVPFDHTPSRDTDSHPLTPTIRE